MDLPKNETISHKQWAFLIGFNSISWNDQLNNNYKSALALADFSNTSALGNQFYFGVQKALGKKMRIDASLSYTRVNTKSGHNAVINYNSGTESNLENEFESVTLATPYGFMDSDFIIQRADGSVSEDVNLLSAIHSQHQLDFIGIHSSLSYELLRYKRMGFELNYGLGYYYLNQISNQLDYLNTNHSDYNYSEGQIISSQQGMSTGFFEMNIGSNLTYDVCQKLTLGFSYDFNQGLTPMFKETDFSSTTQNHSFGAFARRNF